MEGPVPQRRGVKLGSASWTRKAPSALPYPSPADTGGRFIWGLPAPCPPACPVVSLGSGGAWGLIQRLRGFSEKAEWCLWVTELPLGVCSLAGWLEGRRKERGLLALGAGHPCFSFCLVIPFLSPSRHCALVLFLVVSSSLSTTLLPSVQDPWSLAGAALELK